MYLWRSLNPTDIVRAARAIGKTSDPHRPAALSPATMASRLGTVATATPAVDAPIDPANSNP